VRGSTAKRLRKIVRALNLASKTGYADGGVLRRRPNTWGYDENGKYAQIPGDPIARPTVLVECFRRAYKEAKKIYKGLPPTALLPATAGETVADYNVRVIKSMKAYYDQAN
jgi:hypothetical protein